MLPFPQSTAPPVSPFGAPPPMPFPDPGMMVGMDPTTIISMLTSMDKSFEPKYPVGYKKPKRPKVETIWQEARREESRNKERTERQMDTVRRLRFEKQGIFPRDKAADQLGDVDKMVMSDLVDDWQLLSGIVASFDERYTKQILNRSNMVGGQTLEDFAALIRQEEEYRWAETGDMPLRMAESKVLTSYGQIIWRVLCNLDDPDFPFDITLVDPISFFPISGGRKGLVKAFRLMRMTYAQACAEWGEPSEKDREKLTDSDPTRVITVCEYADTWYRAAITEGGCAFLPVTEHKYGFVPFILQGGPAGEPLFTDTARDGRSSYGTGPSDDWGMKHKLVSSITLQQERHDQLESVMSRIMTAINNNWNPSYILYRDQMLLGQPLPDIDNRSGKVNELSLGDRLEAMPQMNAPADVNNFLQMVDKDKMTGMIPLGMYGQQTGSQQTGNSMSVASESGMDHITPWVKSLETGQTRKIEACIRLWRNWGHLSRFQDGDEHEFMVPSRKPTSNGELAHALTPELIDAVGPRVIVTMTRLRTQELMQLANIANMVVPLGMPRRRMFEKMGEHDYDRMREEWIEEMEWDTMQQDEELRRNIKIPIQIKQWADEAGSEEDKAMYLALMDFWMQRQQAQAMQPPQGGAPPGGPPGMPPPGGMPPGGPPPPAPNGGGGANTLNFAGLGAGPGVDGGQVGRPPGM